MKLLQRVAEAISLILMWNFEFDDVWVRKTWPGLNVLNVLGQVGAGGTLSTNDTTTFSRIVTLVKMRTCKKKMDRVQDHKMLLKLLKWSLLKKN